MNAKVEGAQEARFAYRVGDPLIPRDVESATLSEGLVVIGDTGTVAIVGDFFRATEGPLEGLEIPIVEVSTNSFSIASAVKPLVNDDFYIMRYITQRTDDTGAQIVTLTQGPTIFIKDAVSTEVEEDTAVPANSAAFPVKLIARVIDFGSINLDSTNVTTSAYVTLVAATAAYASEVEIDNTTGKSMLLAFGAAASEVDQLIIPAKGLSRQAIAIPAGTRLSVKAQFANGEDVGELNANLFN